MKNFVNIVTMALTVIGMCTFSTNPLDGCTGARLRQKDGSVVVGRTLEFSIDIQPSVVVVPRGYAFTGTTPKGEGLKYTSKYAVIGSICFDQLSVVDGMNEKGLSVGTFYFPGFASYTPVTPENQSKGLSSMEFANWILTQFSTIEEVKAALASVVITPTILEHWGPETPPMHYNVYDKNGNSIVIEPLDGQLKVYDSPLGILTNAPEYPWHMANLRNYVNLTTMDAKPVTIDGVVFKQFGIGSGLVGLPGSFTPPDRFVRVAIFSAAAKPSNTADEGVNQLFHILNQFDIPIGVSRQVINGVEYTDWTSVTIVRDPQSLKYYFRTYEDQNIRVIDLTKFDLDAKEIKKATTKGGQIIADFSSALK